MPGADWFPGGTLNYAEHALAGSDTPSGLGPGGDRRRSEDGTEELDHARPTCAAGSAPRRPGCAGSGVGAGDRVVALVPNGIHALVGFLATAALGAVWSSCSPDFGPGSVIDRFTQISPTVLIAVDGYRYGGKDFAIIGARSSKLRAALPGLSGAVHIPVLGIADPGRDDHAGTSFVSVAGAVEFTPVPFSAPLWVLYSSGTTGLPKPIVQSVGGILLEHLKSIGLQADLGPGDRFFWFTTTGWMMWNYLVGGLLVGATIVLYDGSPGYPDLMTLWRLAERHRVSYFGTSAPFVASCRKAGLAPAAAGPDVDRDHRLDRIATVRRRFPTGSTTHVGAGHPDRVAVRRHRPVHRAWSAPRRPCRCGWGRSPAGRWERGSRRSRRTGESLIDEVGELVITAPMPSMPVFFWVTTTGPGCTTRTSPTTRGSGGTATGSGSPPAGPA